MKPPVRIQRNLLAASERRLLNWLSEHLPMWVTPDKMTTLGFFGALAVGAGFALSAFNPLWLWFAIGMFFVNWFGDSLDGSLARYRKIERPDFGYFVDHSCDALGNMAIMIGIGLTPYVRLDVALIGLAVYFLLSIHTFLAARVVNEFNLTQLGGGPTELRLIIIAMAICMFHFGVVPIGYSRFSVFDAFILGFSVILLVVFIVQTFILGRKLRRLGK
jgi:phosphatidylglycerophosphate synthase